jgi:hypothetical protein
MYSIAEATSPEMGRAGGFGVSIDIDILHSLERHTNLAAVRGVDLSQSRRSRFGGND